MPTTSLMIKSAKDGEGEVESSPNWKKKIEITSREIFPIYRTWFLNLSLILGIKSLNFRDRICSSLPRINLPRKKVFGN